MFEIFSNLWENTKDLVLDRVLPVQNSYLGVGYARRKNANAKLVGYKRAGLFLDSNNNIVLTSMHGRGNTALDADATCSYTSYGFSGASLHAAPDWNCDCGFYAYDDAQQAVEHSSDPSNVLLKVVLSGKYVRYQFGWRYAHQRVTEVVVGRCSASYRCEQSATAFVKTGHNGGELKPACLEHAVEEPVKRRFTFDQLSQMLTASSTPGYKAILVSNIDETVKPATAQQLTVHPSVFKKIKTKIEDSDIADVIIAMAVIGGGAGIMLVFNIPHLLLQVLGAK